MSGIIETGAGLIHQAMLDRELLDLQDAWKKKDRNGQDLFYASEFLPAFLPAFTALPVYRGESLTKPRGLVSTLGMSWQPTVLMAARARAEKILVIGTEESLGPEGRRIVPRHFTEETVDRLIVRLSGMPREAFHFHCVDADDENAVYTAVRDFVQEVGAAPGEVWVDPTAGKKSMSAAAALAAYVLKMPLVYVDYAEYLPENRIPKAGTEYPRCLSNPLAELGDMEKSEIRRAIKEGNYDIAVLRAWDLHGRLDTSETGLYLHLASAYAAWDAFKFEEALESLEKALTNANDWRPEICAHLERQASLLRLLARAADASAPEEQFAREAALPAVLNLWAAARRALNRGQVHQAVMLLNASAESFVKYLLWRDHAGLWRDTPGGGPHHEVDFRKLPHQEAIKTVGAARWGENYNHPNGKGHLTLINGMQVWLAWSGCLTGERVDFWKGPLSKLSALRNSLPHAHGASNALHSEDAQGHLEQTMGRMFDLFRDDEDKNFYEKWVPALVFLTLDGPAAVHEQGGPRE